MALLLTLVLIFSCSPSSGEIKDITPKEAFELVKNPETYLVDVRSIAEYVLVGHAEMGYNVPLTFWEEEEQRLFVNERFLEDLKARFKAEDTLVFICRSGGRSRRAALIAREAGFQSAYNVNEGFEGEGDEKGYKTIGGWKNSGLPYTYDINPALSYSFKK